jgi:hypothetical protein
MTTQQVSAMFRDDRPGEQAPANWRKSSQSYSSGGCVEVATGSRDLIRVRDSKNPRGIILGFSPADWNTFVGGIRGGKFPGR